MTIVFPQSHTSPLTAMTPACHDLTVKVLRSRSSYAKPTIRCPPCSSIDNSHHTTTVVFKKFRSTGTFVIPIHPSPSNLHILLSLNDQRFQHQLVSFAHQHKGCPARSGKHCDQSCFQQRRHQFAFLFVGRISVDVQSGCPDEKSCTTSE